MVYTFILQVYCDMDTDGGGWTVFQRRKDGSQNFHFVFAFVEGFGDLNGEFWLGLDPITRLTPNHGGTSLRVDLLDSQGHPGYATYDTFGVSLPGYQLTVANFTGGNARDSLIAHSGALFQSRVGHIFTCSGRFFSSWWFTADYSCFHSNLNGLYTPRQDRQQTGILWNSFSRDPLTFSEMKLRRRY